MGTAKAFLGDADIELDDLQMDEIERTQLGGQGRKAAVAVGIDAMWEIAEGGRMVAPFEVVDTNRLA